VLEIFPPQFVYYTEVENHLELKQKYLQSIQEDLKTNKFLYESKSSWTCNVASSFFGNKKKNLSMFGDDFYDEVIWHPLGKLKEELHQKVSLYKFPKKIQLTQVWYNSYDPGYYQEYHQHGTANFSGIYLIDLQEKNKTVFRQKLESSIMLDKYYSYNTKHLQEGMVIIFPSNLPHCVQPCENNRTSISFNLKITKESLTNDE
jgi:hypothetical protein